MVAADDTEVPRLRELEQRGAANGLEGLRWLGRDEMREIEPHVGGVAALARAAGRHRGLRRGLRRRWPRRLRERGARVVTGARVKRLRPAGCGDG